MTFKNELSFRSSVLAMSKNPSSPGRPATISFKLISRTTCFSLASPCGSKESRFHLSLGAVSATKSGWGSIRVEWESGSKGNTRRHCPKHLFRRAWGWGYYRKVMTRNSGASRNEFKLRFRTRSAWVLNFYSRVHSHSAFQTSQKATFLTSPSR